MKYWLGLCACILVGCGGETEGKQVEVSWQLGAAEDNAEFDTGSGWHVKLTEAKIALGAIFLFGAASEKAGAIATVSRWFVPVAHAHGGLDPETGRPVRAELLEPFVLDALADKPTKFAKQAAEAGKVDALKLEIAAASGADLSDARGMQLYLRGEAQRDGVTVRFAGGVRVAETSVARRIEHTQFAFTLREGSTIRIEVRAASWLDQAEFDRLATDVTRPITDELTLDAQSQVGRALLIGVRNPDAYSLTIDP